MVKIYDELFDAFMVANVHVLDVVAEMDRTVKFVTSRKEEGEGWTLCSLSVPISD